MLTVRMQVQHLADRLAGFPVEADARFFTQPWLACWNAINSAAPGLEQDALYKATAALPNQKEIFETIIGTRPGFVPRVRSLDDMGPEFPPIEWVWQDHIPRGLLGVLGASQGSGKSFVGIDLAYRIIHNTGFPDGSPIQRPGANVIYVDAESVPQIMRQRANYYQMDQTKLFPMLADIGEMIDLGAQKYQDRLVEMAGLLKPELILIDSLSAVHTNGQNNVEDLRALVGYLTRLAGWANCGLVLIHHIRKTSMGNRMMNVDFGMEDLSGSGYITQQARVVLGLRVVQTGPEFDPNGPRELKVLKSNLGAYPKPIGFSFEPVFPEGARLKWVTEPPKAYSEPTQMDVCKEWLEDLLRDKSAGVKVSELLQIGYEEGFSRPTIFRARRELQSRIHNTHGRKSPDNAWQWADQPVQPNTLEEDETE
jgi:hypothetical protein